MFKFQVKIIYNMSLLSALAIGLISFIAIQYFIPDISIAVSVFIAGFIAGLLAGGIIKGLFVGLVISVVGIVVVVYFFGGIPGFGTDIMEIIAAVAGVLLVGLAAIASIAGAALKRYKFSK